MRLTYDGLKNAKYSTHTGFNSGSLNLFANQLEKAGVSLQESRDEICRIVADNMLEDAEYRLDNAGMSVAPGVNGLVATVEVTTGGGGNATIRMVGDAGVPSKGISNPQNSAQYIEYGFGDIFENPDNPAPYDVNPTGRADGETWRFKPKVGAGTMLGTSQEPVAPMYHARRATYRSLRDPNSYLMARIMDECDDAMSESVRGL